MRLKQIRLKEFKHCAAVQQKDGEGGTYTEYEAASPFLAEAWAAGGKLQTQMYGERISNIWNLRVPGPYKMWSKQSGKVEYEISTRKGKITLTAGDGICFHSDTPDYKIIAIYPNTFLTMEIELI